MILRRYCSFIEYNTPSTSEGKFFVHGTDIKLKRLSENVDGCRPPSDLRCINQTRNGTLSPFWEWTMLANYEGTVNIHERDCDLWSYAVRFLTNCMC